MSTGSLTGFLSHLAKKVYEIKAKRKKSENFSRKQLVRAIKTNYLTRCTYTSWGSNR